MPRRVVITGMGAVTPLGHGTADTLAALLEGRHAIRRMPEWETCKGLRSFLAAPAELKNEKLIPRQARRTMSRMSLFAAQAAHEALRQAGLTPGEPLGPRAGCVAGSTTGSPIMIAEAFGLIGPDRDFTQLTAVSFFQCLSHTVAMNVAQFLGLQGVCLATNAACASSLQAIGAGLDLIRTGRQDLLLCGGAEELHPTVTGSFDLLMAASIRYNDRPDHAPRPFDADRDGLVCGEGAGFLLLEELEHARRRGAPIFAELLGYHTCGSGAHVSESSRASILASMQTALEDARLAPAAIGYINAHATATLQGDGEEAAAIRDLFGGQTPVSSLKGHLGHTLGASGAIELIAALLALRQGRLIPTRNLEHIASDCQGIRHLQQPEATGAELLLKNSFAFGGINASLVCRCIPENGTPP